MNKKQCNRCKVFKSSSDFYTKTGKLGGNKCLTYACKSCEIKRMTDNERKNRKRMIEYKGGKCIRCGYNKCTNALEFHHRDRSKKEISFSVARSMSERIIKELDKCDLLCANCHREVEYLKRWRR